MTTQTSLMIAYSKLITGDWEPGEVFITPEGFRFETISPTEFVVSMEGVEDRYSCDISGLLPDQESLD